MWKNERENMFVNGNPVYAKMCEIHFLAQNWLRNKQEANGRGRVKSKVMKKEKVSREHEILFYFLQFISFLCVREPYSLVILAVENMFARCV